MRVFLEEEFRFFGTQLFVMSQRARQPDSCFATTRVGAIFVQHGSCVTIVPNHVSFFVKLWLYTYSDKSRDDFDLVLLHKIQKSAWLWFVNIKTPLKLLPVPLGCWPCRSGPCCTAKCITMLDFYSSPRQKITGVEQLTKIKRWQSFAFHPLVASSLELLDSCHCCIFYHLF